VAPETSALDGARFIDIEMAGMGLPLISGSSSREQTLKCLERLPTLSPMRTQLLSRLARRNCDVIELTEIVEKDAVLTAQVLRLANSAIFGRAQPINSVKHAIAMIGVSAMRKFALGSSISNLFSRFRTAPSFSMTRFNLHSVATGTLVELISDEIEFEQSNAFIAGLLHDVGKLLIAVSMPKQYEEILAVAAVSGDPMLACEREILGTDHAELSGLAISRWELAEPIRWAAWYHHEPEHAVAVERTGPGKLSLTLAVHRADAFVNGLGMSVFPTPLARSEAPSLDFPGFSFSKERVIKRFEPELKTLTELFR
jgi:HD-like signal output (HDOD) protein